MRRACGVPLAIASALGICLALLGCAGVSSAASYSIATGGNAQRGRQLISAYGCGACHIIPGIRTARGLVGPPLFDFGERTIIAGELPNTPGNLERWIENPKAIEPDNAMPDLGVTPQEATDMAAYLYALREERPEQ